MKITIIAAFDEGRVIGNKGVLPWRIPEDLKLLKQTTEGKNVLMGSNTYEGLPEKFRPLPNRCSFVVSERLYKKHKGTFDFEDGIYDPDKKSQLFYCRDVEEALCHCEAEVDSEVFVLGGGRIYEFFLKNDLVDRMLISHVHGRHEGDVFFPEFGPEWAGKLISKFEKFEVVEYIKDTKHL